MQSIVDPLHDHGEKTPSRTATTCVTGVTGVTGVTV
jgi:hypothetical protein